MTSSNGRVGRDRRQIELRVQMGGAGNMTFFER